MAEEADPPPVKHKLGKRAFTVVNTPAAEPDPNDAKRVLGQNLARDPSLEIPGIEEEVAAFERARRTRHLKVFLFLAVVNAICFGLAAKLWDSPYVAVPLVASGAMITAGTLWVVYVVMRR